MGALRSPAYCTIYAANTPQAGGTAVVQVVIAAIAGERNFRITFEFTDTTTGPFSPSIYAPPAIGTCQIPKQMTANPLHALVRLALAFAN